MIRIIPAKKPRRNYEESDSQCALIQWWRMAFRGLGVADERLLFSIPNGAVRRGNISSGILVDEGLRSGIPDLFLAVPRNSLPGLFIEMKARLGVVSVYQSEMLVQLRNQGYRALVARSFDEARAAIEDYLRPPPP